MKLLVLLGVVFGSLLCWHLCTRKYLNPYKLYLVFGKKGSGKSTYLVKLAKQHLKNGWFVYTNMDEMYIPGVRHFNVDHLGDFVPVAESLLLLDEVGMIWDNRDYKVFRPQVRDFFKLQRHYKVKVYMASQSFDVDKKLRDLCDGMFLHTNFLRVFSLGKRITRKITITASTSEAESRIALDLKICPPWEWTLTFIPRWARYFDSHVVPAMPPLVYQEDKADVVKASRFRHVSIKPLLSKVLAFLRSLRPSDDDDEDDTPLTLETAFRHERTYYGHDFDDTSDGVDQDSDFRG